MARSELVYDELVKPLLSGHPVRSGQGAPESATGLRVAAQLRPPTGNRVEITGITIEQFAEGKIVEDWTNFDALGMLQQLGLVPESGQAGS